MNDNISTNKKIKILDCTLRDGGSINNWNFGYCNIINIIQTLNDAGIEIIENGFLQDGYDSNEDYSISSSLYSFDTKLEKIQNKHFKSVTMIDIGKYNTNNLPDKSNTLTDGIRLMFKKNELKNAISACENIIDKGYSLSLNPVSITTYTKEDIKELCGIANELRPSIVYIIDTYGLLDKNETLKYFDYFNSSLNDDIEIGYHAHNNLQLAFSNSSEIINNSDNRTLVIDGSLYGMGKRAGNTPIELIANYLNNNYSKEYNINKINEIIESIIMPLHYKYEWGYSLIHYLAAINHCHSDYVTYLHNNKKLNFNQIDKLLKKISDDNKLIFNKEYIEQLYNSETILV